VFLAKRYDCSAEEPSSLAVDAQTLHGQAALTEALHRETLEEVGRALELLISLQLQKLGVQGHEGGQRRTHDDINTMRP